MRVGGVEEGGGGDNGRNPFNRSIITWKGIFTQSQVLLSPIVGQIISEYVKHNK